MRLIRLTKSDIENDNTGLFNCDFNDGIDLKPNSKIALQSVSADLETTQLTIDDNNNGISVSVKSGFTRNGTLANFSYNTANGEQLLQNISSSLNNTCRWETGLNKVLGMEFGTTMGNEGLVDIEYRIAQQGEYADPTDNDRTYAWQSKNVTVTGDPQGGEGIYAKTIGQPASASFSNSVINNKIEVAKGNGYFRVQPHTLTDTGDNTTNGFILALTTFKMDPNRFSHQEKNINYGLYMTIDTASGNLQFYPIEKGVRGALSAVTPSPVVAGSADNDILEITIDGSAVDINVYQGASATKSQISTMTYNRYPTSAIGGSNIVPMLIFHADNANAKVQNVRWTPSPWNARFTGENQQALQVGQPHTGAVQPPTNAQPISETSNFLEFDDKDVAKFLGFLHPRIPRFGTIRASNPCLFSSPDQIPFHSASEIRGFLIQLLNINVNSYDSLREQRENLLAVIPDLDFAGKLVYSPPTPYFIDLNNPDTITLRNVKARITNFDYSNVEMDGFGQINLLIE